MTNPKLLEPSAPPIVWALVQLLDSRLGRERCCFFEEDNDHLSIEANVKYTQSNLRIRKTDDFVFPARKDIPWGNYGKIFIKLEGAD